MDSSTMSSMTTGYNTSTQTNDSHQHEADYYCITLQNGDSEIKFYVKFVTFVTFVSAITGCVGNTLSIIVFCSKRMREVSPRSIVYLLMLAISDTTYLASTFMAGFLPNLRCLYFPQYHTIDFFNRSTVMCKLLQYCIDLFSDYSVCLILLFTIQRFIAIYRPLKVKMLCSVCRAWVACGVVFLILATVIAPHHMLYLSSSSLHPYGHIYNICTVSGKYKSKFLLYYMIELSCFRIIPVIVVAVLNVFIIVKITVIKKERKKGRYVAARSNEQNHQGNQDKSTQMTTMLLLVSITYILAYIPHLVYILMVRLDKQGLIDISTETALTLYNYSASLYVFGYSINFFLYTLGGSVFREQLMAIVCPCVRTRHNRNSPSRPRTGTTNQAACGGKGKAEIPAIPATETTYLVAKTESRV